MHWPSKEQIISAANQVQRDRGKGSEAIARSEELTAELRSHLDAEFHGISLQQLAGDVVNLRKAGLLEKASTGNGQRSEADLESEGCKQLGGTRKDAADVYRWTQTKEYKDSVRKIVLERDSNRCQFCYSTERLNVHHRSYKRCRTRYEVDDCITLCRTCHGFLHDAWNKRKCGKPSPLQLELTT